MLVALILSVSSGAMELVVGILLLTLSTAQGYNRLRWFALCALAAFAVSITNALYLFPDLSTTSIVLATRVNGLAAAVASVSWLAYARVRRGLRPLDAGDRVLGLAIAMAGVASMVPGLVSRSVLIELPVPALGLTYQSAEPTLLAIPALALAYGGIAASVRHLWRAGSSWGRRLHLAAVALLLAGGANDVLVTLGLISSMYVVDLTFGLMCVAVGVETAQAMKDTALRLERHSAILRDEVAARTRELVVARAELERSERLAGLGRLAAGVGHEINNPLCAVSSNLEFVLEAVPREKTAVFEALQDALASARRIAIIVAQLNELTRRAPTPGAATSVEPLLRGAVHRAERNLPVGTRVEWDIAEVPAVVGEPEKLALVLDHLLENAAHAMAMPDRPRRLTISARMTGPKEVELLLTDTGEGISSERLPLLFEPFQSTRLGRGLGLGLAICHSIVECLGGRIETTSELGRGTTMRLLLPAAEQKEPALPAAAAGVLVVDGMPPPSLAAPEQPTPDAAGAARTRNAANSAPVAPDSVDGARITPGAIGSAPVPPDSVAAAPVSRATGAAMSLAPRSRRARSRARVLVIDDDESVARSLGRLLGDHEVEVVTNGTIALERLLARDKAYDLVLCDLAMPGLPGSEVFAEVERNAPEAAGRFVFITGGAIDSPARDLLARQGIRYLVKPVDHGALRELVDAAALESKGTAPSGG